MKIPRFGALFRIGAQPLHSLRRRPAEHLADRLRFGKDAPLAGPGAAPHGSEFKAKILDEEGFSPPVGPGTYGKPAAPR